MDKEENNPAPTTLNLGEFIASIPAMLGMVPNHSIVIATITITGRVGAVARVDHNPATVISAVDKLKQTAQADAVNVALVSAHSDGDTAEDTLLVATRRAHALGLEVPIATVISEYTAGAFYFDFPSATSGYLTDPRTSAIAAERAVEGRAPFAASRDALAAELAVIDDTPALFARQWEARHTRAEAPQATDAENLDTYRAAIRDRRALTAIEAAALAVTLADNPKARDIALYFSQRDGAEAILTDAARHTAGYARFAILSILATVTYAHGNGARAGVAIEAIESEAAHETQIPKLAVLMRQVLDHAMHPDGMTSVLEAGHKILPDFGLTDED
ncbi:DUF4192 domain-containing protein [Rhodococcus phenolicus]|uniref:DUF4192 domain-containing protein n=1 Tax=Rhodococcus phenolicus TaxID=263849 RepID=UPI000B2D97EC|nr:DUF4192 domain-containing protein [Rhodococcus phenolicus]